MVVLMACLLRDYFWCRTQEIIIPGSHRCVQVLCDELYFQLIYPESGQEGSPAFLRDVWVIEVKPTANGALPT